MVIAPSEGNVSSDEVKLNEEMCFFRDQKLEKLLSHKYFYNAVSYYCNNDLCTCRHEHEKGSTINFNTLYEIIERRKTIIILLIIRNIIYVIH
jgi:hypothetical protein